MKQLLLSIIITALSTTVHAASITVADQFIGSNGSFITSPTGSPLTQTELANTVTSDAGLFVMSNDNTAYIDLGFSSPVFTVANADLVIYTIGNDYNFKLQVFDSNQSMISNYLYNVLGDGSATLKDSNNNPLCAYISADTCSPLSSTAINLFNNETSPFAIADGTEISMIRLSFGSSADYKSGTVDPRFSLAAAVYSSTPAAVVPLPLPIILFSSGLVLLGWTGRKKKA